MKSINKIFFFFLVALTLGIGASSCVNDLDLKPESATSYSWADIEANPDEYLPQAFNKCYAVYALLLC